ncbi:MAG TPA: T9SS type A sorting domain-containing protein, partial [Tenuifilaceae bacterium]|nr:T9SS type A sorting domain-containing protein [Tenuifilaceae bacterium]
LTLTEVGVGNSVISLRAEDDGGNVVYDDFLFMVNIAPEVVSPIDDIEQEEGFITFTIDLNEVFADANNDELNYSATSDDQSVVSVSVDAGVLTVVEVGVGSSTIEVVADDGMANVSESFVFTVTPFVSVSTFADANSKLYPNPTRGNVSLQLPSLFSGERIDVRVYSTIGQLVYHKKLSVIDKGLVEVNLSSLPQGVYYLRISSSNQIVGSKPIVIQK